MNEDREDARQIAERHFRQVPAGRRGWYGYSVEKFFVGALGLLGTRSWLSSMDALDDSEPSADARSPHDLTLRRDNRRHRVAVKTYAQSSWDRWGPVVQVKELKAMVREALDGVIFCSCSSKSDIIWIRGWLPPNVIQTLPVRDTGVKGRVLNHQIREEELRQPATLLQSIGT